MVQIDEPIICIQNKAPQSVQKFCVMIICNVISTNQKKRCLLSYTQYFREKFVMKSNSSTPLSILIASFNTHRLYPPPDINLSSWLIHKSHSPHIVAIGLQELPLTFTLFQQKSEYEWIKLIEKTLPNYQLLSRIRLNGIEYRFIIFIYHLFYRFNPFYLSSIIIF